MAISGGKKTPSGKNVLRKGIAQSEYVPCTTKPVTKKFFC
jgi:hypothetical protein